MFQGSSGMNINLLHISDLHRDINSPISNQALLDSLEKDREQYASSDGLGIESPDIIIVSGDIVQGVRHGSPDAESKLQRQYDEALGFLDELADRFVAGNKRSIVIVPGNHDVSDHHFRESLEPVPIPNGGPKELIKPLFSGQSHLRWSWDDLTLYSIADTETYAERFQPFASFYKAFYDGERSYSTDEREQFDIFDYPNLGVTVTGFSSCSNNDLLNRPGAIHPECIAAASTEWRGNEYKGRLRLAVWHHHIEGPPLETDYMDPDIVQNLVYRDVSLGLHGHQHKPQYLGSRFRYGSDRKITLISAGTLCGGAAYGFRRSYNLIQLNLKHHCGRLHVREMQNDNLQLPIWGQHSSPSNPTGTLDFTFDAPRQTLNEQQHTPVLLEAQRLYDQDEFCEAARVLLPLQERDELARRILLDCLVRLQDDGRIIAAFDPPKGSAEEIAIMDALWAANNRGRLTDLLRSPSIANTEDLSVAEVRNRYRARLER